MIFCVLGPTASGKSDLAEEISKLFNAKVVNFDAFQVYKEMNKGTAKPNKELLNSGRYFLYDFVSIAENYDVSKYQKDARIILDNSKNENIVMVGGTGLYLKAALYDYKFLEEEQMPEDFCSDLSNEQLFQKLLLIDEKDANLIGNNNRKRLLRALYIYEIHHKTKTEINNDGKNKLLYDDVVFVGLDLDRNELYERIDLRTENMVNNGLKNEVNEILTEFGPSSRALQAIGYKEFFLGLSEEETVELIKKNTKNYAKRQMTFFKHQFNNVNWFKNIDDALQYIVGIKNGI
jgi:tRNA dimethylallyltransferase